MPFCRDNAINDQRLRRFRWKSADDRRGGMLRIPASYYIGGLAWREKCSGLAKKRGETKVKLSSRGRYAVMAMADLAHHSGGEHCEAGRTVCLAAIATRQEISLAYLEQLFAKLRRSVLVSGVRGPGGGYRLVKPAEEVSIAEIVLAVDEPLKATRCHAADGAGCMSKSGRCLTHDLWDELGARIEQFLSSVTLADVVERRVRDHARVGKRARPQAPAPLHRSYG